MTSRITEYEFPNRFVDEQVRGPFARWWHEHRFVPQADGSTIMSDRVEYRSPLGAVGRLVDYIRLERYMRDLLTERNNWLKQALERRPDGLVS